MSLVKFGTLTLSAQADSQLVYRPDGLIEGQIVYIGDQSQRSTAMALIGSAHPSNSAVYLYAVHERKLRAQRYEWTFDCIGLSKDPTDRIAQIIPQISTAPIETHPNFTSALAGTPAAPLNGAYFDPVTREFIAFTGGDAAANKKIGLRSYYTGSCIVRATHYTRQAPKFSESCKIKETLQGIPEVAGVTNWLYTAPAWDPIPGTTLHKVSEEWIGSSGGDGWDSDVYGT
jgi:hypothetical protein